MAISTKNMLEMPIEQNLSNVDYVYIENNGAIERLPWSKIKEVASKESMLRACNRNAGKEITLSWADLSAKIKTGDFSGLEIGDYKDITCTDNEKIRMELSGFNNYMFVGDTEDANVTPPNIPHLVFTTKDCLKDTHKMNETNITTGGYTGSLMPAYLETVYNKLPADFKAVIKPLRRLECGNIGGKDPIINVNGTWAWQTRKIWLLSEIEVYGCPIWSAAWGCGNATQLPIFANSWAHRVKGQGYESLSTMNNSKRIWWWLDSPSSVHFTHFCRVDSHGLATDYYAGNLGGVTFGCLVS